MPTKAPHYRCRQTEDERLTALIVKSFNESRQTYGTDLRDDWVKIGMAIHSMDSTQVGFDLWDK
jgi:hypothetical protein